MPLIRKRMKIDPVLVNQTSDSAQAGSKYALDYDSCVSKEPELKAPRPRMLHQLQRDPILESKRRRNNSRDRRQRSASKDAEEIKRLQVELQRLR